MFGVALRLLAAGGGSRHLGDYAKNLTARYMVLGVAGTVFLVATGFAVLAGFWALSDAKSHPGVADHDGDLLFAGLSIALTAYGITRETGALGARRRCPQAAQSYIPSVDDVGREIETAVHRYGPFRSLRRLRRAASLRA